MKLMPSVLLGCRLVVLSFGLTVISSGCGNATPPPTSGTEEERKWDAETRNAMEAASKSAAKKR